MIYAFISLSLSLIYGVRLMFYLYLFLYPFLCCLFFYIFSNTIRPRKIKNELIGIILIGKRFDRE